MGVRNPLAVSWALTLLALVMGAALALVVPAGQPYDEPAHYSNVEFYAEHHRMPVLGEPEVHYEGQMGPGYYVPAAAVLLVTGTIEDPRAGLLTLRLCWLLLIPCLAWGTYRLTRVMGSPAPWAVVAVGLVVLNPSMLAIAASVQNDYLAISMAVAGALLAVRALRDESSLVWSAGAGGVIGLAVLVKVFAGGLLIGFLAAVLLDRHQTLARRCARAAVSVAAMASVSGWWFVRNLRLYGDLTGAGAVERAGFTFPPLEFTGVGSVLGWIRSLIAYAFAPTEFYRNAFDAPVILKIIAVSVTGGLVLLVVTALLHSRRSVAARLGREPRLVFALVSVVVVVAVYAVAAWTLQSIAPRLMFVAAPLAVALLARLGTRPRAGAVALGLLAIFLVIDVWLVLQTASLQDTPELFPWGGQGGTVAQVYAAPHDG